MEQTTSPIIEDLVNKNICPLFERDYKTTISQNDDDENSGDTYLIQTSYGTKSQFLRVATGSVKTCPAQPRSKTIIK